MAKTSTNGASEHLPSGWESWPTMLDATKELSVHHTVIRRFVADGMLKQIVDPEGRKRFAPADIVSLKAYAADLPDDEKQPPIRAVGGITHEEFAGATSLVKQVYAHHQTMIPLLVNAWAEVMRVGREQSERDARRIAELESARDAASLARENMISQEHERALASKVIEASEARKSKAFSTLIDTAAPMLVKKLGLEGDPMIGTALNLFKSLKRDQILMMIHPAVDFVTPDQKAQLLKILGELSPEEKQGLGMTESPEQKGTEK